MNREDILRLAREARIEQDGDMLYSFRNSDKDQDVRIEDLERFAVLVAAAEREACAKVCEGRLQEGLNFEGCAAAIRARGQA